MNRAKNQASHRRSYVERPPELLFHSMDKRTFLKLIQKDQFAYPNNRSIFASKIYGYAWQVAHRTCEYPHVAIIDVGIAKRHNVYPRKNKRNLWEIDAVPMEAILNAHPEYGEQISAGGIPYVIEDGEYKVALIQMRRAHFNSWEVAKGKLELGETPVQAAKREIGEEMGCSFDLTEPYFLGKAQFSIQVNANCPLLKSIHVYLFKADRKITEFNVATEEGIANVEWFNVETAVRLVSYRSLGHIMQSMKRHLEAKGEASLGRLPPNFREWREEKGRLPSDRTGL